MSSTVETALRLAAQGLRIFPLSPNSKRPPLISDWEAGSSCDPAVIAAWAAKHPGCGWAVACGPSGLCVVDVDAKCGKAGHASLCGLEIDNGDLPGLRVETPSGGTHIYLKGLAASSVERVAPGIDIRSDGGYVVAPGTVVDGRPYTITSAAPIVDAPTWLLSLAGKPHAKAEAAAPACELDTPAIKARAAAWLAQAEPAVQGDGGDALTLKTAMRLKDLGLSETACFELLAASWNPRCSPPWSPDELKSKVRNAFAYGSNAPGSDSPEAAFAGLEAPVEHGLTTPADAPLSGLSINALNAADIDAASLPKRMWLLGYRYLPQFVTLTVAPGGIGKSLLSIHEALALASGRGSMVGLATQIEPQNVLLYNAEDPRDEMQRRIAAAAAYHKIGPESLRRIQYLSGWDQPLILVAAQGRTPVVNGKLIDALARHIDTHHIKLLVVDPFIRLTTGLDENDNAQMDIIAKVLSKLAVTTGAAVGVVHHTNKRFGSEGSEGDVGASRGATALPNGARIAHTLCGMGEKTAKEFGIPNAERKFLIRLDDAKANLSPPMDDCMWFRKRSQQLPNGDAVGVLDLFRMPAKVAKTGGDTQDIDSDADERKAARAEKRAAKRTGGIRGF